MISDLQTYVVAAAVSSAASALASATAALRCSAVILVGPRQHLWLVPPPGGR